MKNAKSDELAPLQVEVQEDRIQEIARIIARSQMRDRVRNQEYRELVNEAWLGILEARNRLKERGLEMTEGLVWRVAKLQILRWKLQMRSALTIPAGSANKENKAGRLKVGLEMKDYLEMTKTSRGKRRETEIRKLLKMVGKKVEKKLSWVDRLVMRQIMDGGSRCEAWRQLEELGVKKAKTLAYGAVDNIREAWAEELGL